MRQVWETQKYQGKIKEVGQEVFSLNRYSAEWSRSRQSQKGTLKPKYLIKERIVSSSDPRSVCLSAHTYFDDWLYVIAG